MFNIDVELHEGMIVRVAARAMELFLNKLCEGTAAIATGVHARTATPSHL